MKINNISEGHWEIAPEEYPNSILPKERKAKRHGILAYPDDRKRFMKNMGLAEDKDDVKYDGPQMEPELADKPTPDFDKSWKKIQLPDPPSNSSSKTKHELLAIKNHLAGINKKQRAAISAQDIEDLEDLFFDVLDKHTVEYSHKLYNRACNLVEQLSTIGMHFKQIYNRARPKQLLPSNIAEKIVGGKTAKSASYPSTHAIIGVVLAGIFTKLYPKYSKEFGELGESLGKNRVIAGYHYQSDYDAGVELGQKLLSRNLDKIVNNLKKLMPISEAIVGAVSAELSEIKRLLIDTANKYADDPHSDFQEYEDELNHRLFKHSVVMNHKSSVPAGAVLTKHGAMAVIKTPSPKRVKHEIETIMVMISHELVHVNQINRAEKANPGIYTYIEKDYMDRVVPKGIEHGFDMQAYANDKYEVMAAARTSVDYMRGRGMSKEQIISALKKGQGLFPHYQMSREAKNKKLRYALDYVEELFQRT